MSHSELKSWSPLWLEYSGLPAHLAEKVRGGGGWPVFKKLVELDCDANAEPGTVELPLGELAARCGVAAPALRKIILSLRKLKLVACFLPDHDDEAALFRLRVPLKTPLTIDEIKQAHPRLFVDNPQFFRYVDDFQAPEDNDATDKDLQEIVDLYFDAISLKMNAFILDELRLVRFRFPMEMVRQMFRRAKQNEIRNLHWVVQELIKQKKKRGEEDTDQNKF
jgi:hypothetical protein